MLQQASLTQNLRKKILTRSDLICELEQILGELRERPNFASLRSLSIDAFCATDNPYLKQIILAELATNTSEVLRDSSLVERKEIAALVESLYLINVRSDYSLNLLRDSFSKIEQRVDSVQNALQDVLISIPKGETNKQVVTPEDSNVAFMRKALSELRKSENFAAVKSMPIEIFWDKKASSCSYLSKMTWLEIMETAPSAIFNLPNFGKSRFNHLLKCIEKAKIEAKSFGIFNPQEPGQKSNLIADAQNNLLNSLEEIKSKATLSNLGLADALQQANSQALLTAYLCQSQIQRRVGQLFAVTESRISQLLQEANSTIQEAIRQIAPEILDKLEFRLSSPACSEQVLLNVLGLNALSNEAIELIRVVVKSFTAVNPTFKGKVLKTHWTKREKKFQPFVLEVISNLPLSTRNLSARLEEALVGCCAKDILSVLTPTVFFLRKRDFWYANQEAALVDVLNSSQKPLSADEITDIFETGPRQMRYLLQNSKQIVRIGRNNGRRYGVAGGSLDGTVA